MRCSNINSHQRETAAKKKHKRLVHTLNIEGEHFWIFFLLLLNDCDAYLTAKQLPSKKSKAFYLNWKCSLYSKRQVAENNCASLYLPPEVKGTLFSHLPWMHLHMRHLGAVLLGRLPLEAIIMPLQLDGAIRQGRRTDAHKSWIQLGLLWRW